MQKQSDCTELFDDNYNCDVMNFACYASGLSMSGDAAVKQEPAWQNCADELGVSEAAEELGLYADHQVKDELVFGPELLQPPDAPSHDVCVKLELGVLEQLLAEPESSEGCVYLGHESQGSVLGPGSLLREVDRQTECLVLAERIVLGGKHKCPVCPAAFRHLSTLCYHLSIHYKHNLLIPDNDNNLENTLLIPKTEMIKYEFQCDACGEKFNSKLSLIRHIKDHSVRRKKAFSCHVCKKKFRLLVYLTRHQRIHLGLKPFKCGFCERAFLYSESMKKHVIIHSGEKQHVCKVCDKKFALKSYLKSHERIHTGEKPFICSTCGKRYTDSSSLRTHKNVHLPVKPYGCDVCEKRFSGLANFNRHKRIHLKVKPYECNVCKKRFTNTTAVKVHQRTHTGLKPFSCSICNKQFAQIGQKTRHERIHEGG